ncbi:hypothetical protein ACFL6C_07075 [Myxococcota bacterium]
MRMLRLALLSCLLVSACSDSATIGEPTGDTGASGDSHQAGDSTSLGDPTSPGDPTSGDPFAGDPAGLVPDECANPAPDWVFCSAFEEGNKDIWDDYDGNPDATNLLMADAGPLNLADNHVMRIRVPAGRGGADLVKVLPDSYDRAYARWYMKWEAGYDFTAANHGSGLHAGDRNLLGRSDFRPDGSDWFCSWIEPVPDLVRLNAYTYYRGMYMDCVDPNGSCWGDHFPCMTDEGGVFCEKPQHRETVMPPVLEDDRWYCIEMMLDGGTPVTTDAAADGVLNFWVDGLELGPWDDLWLRTNADLKITIVWLSLFHHGDHSVEGILFDNVVVSTSRIGCLP